jgi:hypothetical protein
MQAAIACPVPRTSDLMQRIQQAADSLEILKSLQVSLTNFFSFGTH